MAMIGRNAAVAEVGKHRHQVEGPVAFAAWLGVHAMLLSGAHSKADAFLSWAWDYFDRDHAATVEASVDAAADRLGRRRPRTSRTSSSTTADADTPSQHTEEDTMADHYDVIIVGSGAGGGTLAHRLAPSGQAGADPGARRLAAARGARTGTPRRCSSTTATSRPTSGTTATASRSSRRSTTSSVARRSSTAPRCTGCASATSVSSSTTAASRRPGRSTYDVMEPYYTQAEQLYQVHGARGEDPTDPPASAPYPFPPVSHEPRIQRLFDDMAAVGLHPFHSPSGVMLDEAEPGVQRLHPVRHLRRVPLPGAREVRRRRRSPSGRRSQHDNVTLVRNAVVRRLRDRRVGPDGDRGRRRGRRRGAAVQRRHRRRLGRRGRTRPRSCWPAPATGIPNGLANGSDQVGRNYVFHNSRAFLAVSTEKNDTRFQKTLGLNDYYFGDADFDYPMGNLQMVGKSSAPMYRGEKPIETAARADVRAARRRRARRRLLAVGRGPARPRQPGDPRPGRQRRAGATRRTTPSRWSSCTGGSRSTWAISACTRTT